MGLTAATLKEQFWYLRSRIPSYLRNEVLVAPNSGKRTTVGSGGFFVYSPEITRRKKGSQEDPFFTGNIAED